MSSCSVIGYGLPTVSATLVEDDPERKLVVGVPFEAQKPQNKAHEGILQKDENLGKHIIILSL